MTYGNQPNLDWSYVCVCQKDRWEGGLFMPRHGTIEKQHLLLDHLLDFIADLTHGNPHHLMSEVQYIRQ